MIYFAKVGEFVKIGCTSNWNKRLPGLKQEYRHLLDDKPIVLLKKISGAQSLERRLHKKFAALRAEAGKSTELFCSHPDLLSYIESLGDMETSEPLHTPNAWTVRVAEKLKEKEPQRKPKTYYLPEDVVGEVELKAETLSVTASLLVETVLREFLNDTRR